MHVLTFKTQKYLVCSQTEISFKGKSEIWWDCHHSKPKNIRLSIYRSLYARFVKGLKSTEHLVIFCHILRKFSNVLRQMPQLPVILTNFDPPGSPRPLFNVPSPGPFRGGTKGAICLGPPVQGGPKI
jgi:hypothetical protein